MAETGNSADVAALMERFTEALMNQARAHAEATVRPKMPSWAVSTLVGLVVACITMMAGGLMTYGALQNRVANLENAHPEALSSLATEVHMLVSRFDQVERRINDISDRRPQTGR